jgi:hypothetical protein
VGHEHRNSIPQTSEKPVDITINLGDFDVGVAILYEERVRNNFQTVF